MNRPDFENVSAIFQKLARLTDEEALAYKPTVAQAEAYFLRLLLRDPADENEKSLCEYACACKAYLDYTILQAASQKADSTQIGGVAARVAGDKTVLNAERNMYDAFAALAPGLVRDDGFIFEGTGDRCDR